MVKKYLTDVTDLYGLFSVNICAICKKKVLNTPAGYLDIESFILLWVNCDLIAEHDEHFASLIAVARSNGSLIEFRWLGH